MSSAIDVLTSRRGRFFAAAFCFLTAVEFVESAAPNGSAPGRARPVVKVAESVGAVLERGVSGAISGENASTLLSPAFGAAAKGFYDVGSQETKWTGRDGARRSALAFYPLTPPRSGGKFPAVVYSRGLGGSAEQFAYLASSWARCGVVVLLLRHPGSDESIWRGKVRPMAELKEAYQTQWPARDRAVAIRSAIDFLYSVHEADGPLGRDVDLSKIGVGGNDLGALAALLVAGQLPPDNGASLKDDRVAAALALSPPVFCDAAQGTVVYSLVDAPLMTVSGTEDDGVVGNTKAFQRRVPFDSVKKSDRYLMTLVGGDHLVYGGHRMKSKQASDAPYQETIRLASTVFWRAYLGGADDATAALRAAGDVSPVSNARFERVLTR